MSPRKVDQLLNTKLMPPRLHTEAIQRADLLARLDKSLTKKLAVLVAPTGFGKTTLVSMWLASRDFPSAWVTLDENDNDPARFWTYVCSALRTLDSAVGKSTLSTLAAPQLPSFQTLLSPLINDLTRLKESSVIVLDDYHLINSEEIHRGMAFLIQHLPESLHILLTTRTEPDLPLPILRVRDELVEINSSDLRFNEQETEAFLRGTLHTDFPSTAAVQLLQKTEGWVAGLRLAALSLQNKSEPAELEKWIQMFSGSDRYVTDYLVKEVFENQAEEIQIFLLKTCFLNRLTGSLCDAITGTTQGAVRLEQLERQNLFLAQLESAGERIWYRYSPLFAESIQGLARQRFGEAAIRAIFEKASLWYEEHGLYEEAIEAALSAKLFSRAITLIEKFIEIHDLRELHTLVRWLENIPQHEIFLHPVICFTYAQVILYSTDRFAPATANRIEPYLRAAESIWREDGNHHRLGQLLSFRGNVVWWQGKFREAFEYANQSLIELPEYDVFWRGNSLLMVGYEALNAGQISEAQDLVLEARALLGAAQNLFGVLAAIQMLAEIFYWQGELEQAEQLNQQILVEAVGDESMLDDQGIASLNLANIAYERNDLESARQQAERAMSLGEQRSNEMLLVQAAIRLADIQAAKGDFAGAREQVTSLETRIQGATFLRDIQNAQALLTIRTNDISSLDWWVKIVSQKDGSALHLQKEHEAFIRARLRIAEGRSEEALDIIRDWQLDAAENGRVRSQVEALCLEALALQAHSNLSDAAKPLIEALRLGQALGFRRTFLDQGNRMAALLQAVLPALPNRTLSLFATTLLHSFPAEETSHLTPAGSTVQIEALSRQELRVLRLLMADLSNADIARELVVSTNTIKTHVKSIYRKLNVKSREEAREAARELKLI